MFFNYLWYNNELKRKTNIEQCYEKIGFWC